MHVGCIGLEGSIHGPNVGREVEADVGAQNVQGVAYKCIWHKTRLTRHMLFCITRCACTTMPRQWLCMCMAWKSKVEPTSIASAGGHSTIEYHKELCVG